MAWFKVDDKLHAHRKVRKAGKAALGLWVLAGSWCMDNDSDGFVAFDVIKAWGGTKADAQRLVDAGLWKTATHKGEDGWRFHDWSHFQPSAAVTAAKKLKERESGLRGNHMRWHVERKINDPDCEFCYRVPDGEPDWEGDGLPESGGESGANRPVPVPEPDPVPHVSPKGETTPALGVASRPDVDRLCTHLADRIAEDGSKRPTITKGWEDAARRMLDLDGRTEAEVHGCIDWCQNHHFWRTNILSMPKLREKFDQLKKVAAGEQQGNKSRRQQETDDMFAKAAQRMGITGGI